jgi:anti-sigma regulatory factor (Ser/Thr protein kinase)
MHVVLPVLEPSHVGQVRRSVQQLASRASVSEDVSGRAALVATELCTNLLKHCQLGGRILFRALPPESGEGAGLEIVSLDKGVGISNISRAFTDGYSTAGSPGSGLGAIQRMSDAMEIYSADQRGTAISTQLRPRTSSREMSPARIRSICVPLAGYEVSGDLAVVCPTRDSVNIMVSDGLGHGELAATASARAGELFRKNLAGELPEIMEQIHTGLRSTRGAAVALARFHRATRILKYVAVGNIESRVWSQETCQGCATLNGTAGARLPTLAQFEYQVPLGSAIIMHTDGLSSRWNLQAYPGLSSQSPGVIGGLLYRDFGRPRDDAMVLVFST